LRVKFKLARKALFISYFFGAEFRKTPRKFLPAEFRSGAIKFRSNFTASLPPASLNFKIYKPK